jgi:hypothetical protein
VSGIRKHQYLVLKKTLFLLNMPLLSSENYLMIGLTSFTLYFLILRFLSMCSELERISASLRDLRDIAARDGELKRMLSSKHLTFIEEWRKYEAGRRAV